MAKVDIWYVSAHPHNNHITTQERSIDILAQSTMVLEKDAKASVPCQTGHHHFAVVDIGLGARLV
jgi:hypothetical protein